jgi:hypothetical protein
LNDAQFEVHKLLVGELGRAGLEWRSIGRTDYPHRNPLLEVYTLAKHCSGGLILGFSQFETKSGIWKKGTPDQAKQTAIVAFPTPWNHIEAGILFSLRRPLLVFREQGVLGGVFDNGVTDLFVHDMPTAKTNRPQRKAIREVFVKWAVEVQQHYYRMD